MAVVCKFAFDDGPGPLVVALEGRDLGAQDGRGPVAVVVDDPVVDAGAKV